MKSIGKQIIVNAGLENFFDESSMLTAVDGVPGSNQFRSTIVNRAPIPDISKNAKCSIGIERISFQEIAVLQNESGPNGQTVYSVIDEPRGLVRMVGDWSSLITGHGPRIFESAATLTDYFEVTFFGTGINLLMQIWTNQNVMASVDGGAEYQIGIFSAGASWTVGRQYANNQIVSAAANLPLGLHTIKVRNNSGVIQSAYNGVEILNESSALNINPGNIYLGGRKMPIPSLLTSQYNSNFESGVLGTRGGRVVAYLKPDGTIGKAVTPTDTQGNITTSGNTTNHSNEQVTRVYNFREFGAGRGDDFAYLISTGTKCFALADGTTALYGFQVGVDSTGNKEALVLAQAATCYLTLNFIGTGCDIYVANTTAPGSNVNVNIDGISVAAGIAGANWTTKGWHKLCSGLPYGTHTVYFYQPVGVTGLRISDFRIYSPVKPNVPAGCLEVADYCVMANFSQVTPSSITVSQGVLRKNCSRESIFSGSMTYNGVATNDPSGFSINSTATNDFVQHTFWGTGFEHLFTTATASYTLQYTVTNALGQTMNLSSYTTGYAGAAISGFVPSTGVLTTSTSGMGSLYVQGLPLGLYTVRVTKTSASGNFYHSTYEIITPIYSPNSNSDMNNQNSLPIGNNSIYDSRKVTPLGAVSKRNRYASACGVLVSPSASAATPIPMPDMSVIMDCTGKDLFVTATTQIRMTGVGTALQLWVYIDGKPTQFSNDVSGVPIWTQANQDAGITTWAANINGIIHNITPGVHKIDIYWGCDGGTVTAFGYRRSMEVVEI